MQRLDEGRDSLWRTQEVVKRVHGKEMWVKHHLPDVARNSHKSILVAVCTPIILEVLPDLLGLPEVLQELGNEGLLWSQGGRSGKTPSRI